MIPKYAIYSTDDNPLYYDFIPIVQRYWHKLGITPICLCVSNNTLYNDMYNIIYIKPIDGVPTYIQAQWVRFWYTQFLDDITIVSDIDMLPLSIYYFKEQLYYIDAPYIHINPPTKDYPTIPACYNIAHPDTFKKYLNLKPTFEEELNKLMQHKVEYPFKVEGKPLWGIDESYLTMSLKDKEIMFLARDGGIDGHRWNRDWDCIGDVNKLYDWHLPRPYQKYEDYILKKLI